MTNDRLDTIPMFANAGSESGKVNRFTVTLDCGICELGWSEAGVLRSVVVKVYAESRDTEVRVCGSKMAIW